jgi:hypothetical protein
MNPTRDYYSTIRRFRVRIGDRIGVSLPPLRARSRDEQMTNEKSGAKRRVAGER